MYRYTVSKPTVYEQALNERIRTFLRLDFLFRQAAHRLRGTSVWDSRTTLASLMDILEVLSRTDMKTELLKELERHQLGLAPLRTVKGVDTQRLDDILGELTRHQQGLHTSKLALGHQLRDNEFLTGIRQRSNVPGGTCDVDLPAYHHWLQHDAQSRTAQLGTWYASLDEVRQPVELLLGLVRESSRPSTQCAEAGFYQQALDSGVSYQMIRVAVPSGMPYFAEISGGRHRFSVRFMHQPPGARPRQVDEDVDFQLYCCAL